MALWLTVPFRFFILPPRFRFVACRAVPYVNVRSVRGTGRYSLVCNSASLISGEPLPYTPHKVG